MALTPYLGWEAMLTPWVVSWVLSRSRERCVHAVPIPAMGISEALSVFWRGAAGWAPMPGYGWRWTFGYFHQLANSNSRGSCISLAWERISF